MDPIAQPHWCIEISRVARSQRVRCDDDTVAYNIIWSSIDCIHIHKQHDLHLGWQWQYFVLCCSFRAAEYDRRHHQHITPSYQIGYNFFLLLSGTVALVNVLMLF